MSMLNDAQRLIHTETGEYPITVAQFRTKGHGWVFGPEVDEAVVNSLGYFVVNPVDAPKGDIVSIGAPEQLEDGTWQDTYTVRAFTPEEAALNLAQAKVAAMHVVESHTSSVCYKGAPFTFGEEVQHIQLRSSDLTNLTGLAQMAERKPDRMYYFRTYENKVNPMTAADVVDMTNAAFEAFEAVMEKKWTVEHTVATATSVEDIPTSAEIKAAIFI